MFFVIFLAVSVPDEGLFQNYVVHTKLDTYAFNATISYIIGVDHIIPVLQLELGV